MSTDQGALSSRLTDDSHHANVISHDDQGCQQIVSLKSDLSSNFSTVAAVFMVRMLQKQSGDQGIAQRGWMSALPKPPPPPVRGSHQHLRHLYH